MTNITQFQKPHHKSRGEVFATAMMECIYVGDEETESDTRYCFVVCRSGEHVGISYDGYPDLMAADRAA